MFIIIIWGTRTRCVSLGSAVIMDCPHCHNRVWFTLYRWRKYFHLYFLPVCTLAQRSFLSCAICSHAIDLNKDGDAAAAELASSAARVRAGAEDQSSYQVRADGLLRNLAAEPAELRAAA